MAKNGFDRAEVSEFLPFIGLTASDLIDTCIPEVTRRAEQIWVDDEASFVDVTLARARLYSLCKALSDEWKPRPRRRCKLTVLVATVPGEQHMIGSVVMTSGLRRRGCSVQLLTGFTQSELIRRLRRGQFDAALISCAGTQTLGSAARLVAGIRAEFDDPPRLVVGGAIENKNPTPEETEAELAISDIEVALSGLEGNCHFVVPMTAQ